MITCIYLTELSAIFINQGFINIFRCLSGTSVTVDKVNLISAVNKFELLCVICNNTNKSSC